jgi:ADP-heptose:LPS heptosyltransferase
VKHLLRTLLLLLIRLIGLPGASTAAREARKLPISQPRILLIRPDHLGDLVLTTPVLNALRERIPDAHITMMVGPWSSEVVARHPAIDKLITCSFPGFQRAPQKPLAPYTLLLSIAKQLRRGHYDLALNLRPDFWWGAALLYLARIPRRIGYAIQPGAPFLTQALPFPPAELATVSCLRLADVGLQALGYPSLAQPYTPERYPLQFIPTADERAWIGKKLTAAGIAAQTPVVVIHPGTGAAVKLWRSEAWAHIADTLTASLAFPTSAQIILTGSKHERALLEEIAQQMTTAPLLLSDLTVGQLAALLERAKLVLGVDSGPLHLAIAQDTPTLQIFGPTDAHIFGPWGNPDRHIVIASTHRCPTCPAIPCGRLDFRPEELPAHPCVKLVTEQEVMQGIEKMKRN